MPHALGGGFRGDSRLRVRAFLPFRVFFAFELESAERADTNPTACQRVTKDDACALQVHV